MSTILIVDDSPSVRQMVRLTLSAAGHSVIDAGNGSEGLEKAKSVASNLVLTDLNMPIMNGIEMIREIRKLPSYCGIPIIFLTTESDASLKAQAKSAGATGWIVKPFQQDQLLGVVKKVLG